nr:hypothetical protein [Tanacetum cinerariifolium]
MIVRLNRFLIIGKLVTRYPEWFHSYQQQHRCLLEDREELLGLKEFLSAVEVTDAGYGLYWCQVSDKDKTGLGYKAASSAVEGFVNSSKILEKQENKSDKGYHEVPPPFTGNYMPPKRDLRLIDEHFESVSVDVSTVSLSDGKTVDVKGVGNQVNTAKGKVVVNAVKGNGFNAVKASASEVNVTSVYGYYCLKSMFVEKLQLILMLIEDFLI